MLQVLENEVEICEFNKDMTFIIILFFRLFYQQKAVLKLDIQAEDQFVFAHRVSVCASLLFYLFLPHIELFLISLSLSLVHTLTHSL